MVNVSPDEGRMVKEAVGGVLETVNLQNPSTGLPYELVSHPSVRLALQ
jgi:hypothetical protein